MTAKKQVSEIPQLITLQKRIDELTAGLMIPLGGIFRIASQAMENWGIRVTESNRKWIEEQSSADYRKEYEKAGVATYHAIDGGIIDGKLTGGNVTLNSDLAKIAVDVLKGIIRTKRPDEKICICDVGPGIGITTGTFLDRLGDRVDESLFQRLDFYFIEPSAHAFIELQRLMKARYPQVAAQYVIATDCTNLPRMNSEQFDMIISNAVVHHNSFSTYIDEFWRVLKKDGAAIIGDWYSEVWYHPELVAYLMKHALNADTKMLNDFINFFEISSWQDVEMFWENCDSDAKRRNQGMLLYIQNLEKNLRSEREKALLARTKGDEISRREPVEVTLNLLEAHEKYDDRKKKWARCFMTDSDKIRKKDRYRNIECRAIQTVPPNFARVDLFVKKEAMSVPEIANRKNKGKKRLAA